jgi:hypothetical protein
MRTQVTCVVCALAVGLVEPGLAQEESGRMIGRDVTEGVIPAAGVRIVV